MTVTRSGWRYQHTRIYVLDLQTLELLPDAPGPNDALYVYGAMRGPQLGDLASDPKTAAACYLGSLAMARDSGAVSYELRAANELAHLWPGTPREADARAHVEAALAQFVDGAGTRDPRDAGAFLGR